MDYEVSALKLKRQSSRERCELQVFLRVQVLGMWRKEVLGQIMSLSWNPGCGEPCLICHFNQAVHFVCRTKTSIIMENDNII